MANTAASLSNLNVSVEEPAPIVEEVKAEAEVVDGAVAQSAVEASPVAAVEEVEEEKEPKKVKKNRCASCKKKVGLTGFACRYVSPSVHNISWNLSSSLEMPIARGFRHAVE